VSQHLDACEACARRLEDFYETREQFPVERWRAGRDAFVAALRQRVLGPVLRPVSAQRLAAQLTGLVLVPHAGLPGHDESAPEALAAPLAAAPPGADAELRAIERATADGLLRWWGLEDPETGILRLRLRSTEPALAGVRLRLRAGPTFSREVVLQARAGRPEVGADVLLSRAERAALQPEAALRVEVMPAEEPEGPEEAAPGRPETAP
jgi:hypothetical protein